MTETEFLARAEAILDHLESQSDDWVSLYDLDIEAKRSGNVLTLIFDDSIHVVVNSQAPMQEMWVAARSGGFHYRFDGERWADTRGGPDMAEALSQICTEASGGHPIKVVV
jgi:CyaY protein